ncbi:hypothetical protein SAMN04487819_12112 [Actinopolyspora alba]|uniref:Uncharacterized protein n=2 Tax=Actinopolyspora alba TaxID=673379 RepID=A0A1I2CEE2_9ACTN|nr:hypothetical protein SAMN04487819_12112 [Actinopolyspora alba]
MVLACLVDFALGFCGMFRWTRLVEYFCHVVGKLLLRGFFTEEDALLVSKIDCAIQKFREDVLDFEESSIQHD